MSASLHLSPRPWWIAWLSVVLGGPLISYLCLLADRKDGGPTIVLMLLCAILNLPFSIVLARRLSARREATGKSRAAVGFSFGLLLGGWALMLALFCAGCAAEFKMDFR
jgi:hypothetical protein